MQIFQSYLIYIIYGMVSTKLAQLLSNSVLYQGSSKIGSVFPDHLNKLFLFHAADHLKILEIGFVVVMLPRGVVILDLDSNPDHNKGTLIMSQDPSLIL